jgi:ATP-binding cassette, subfamily B (MDR/TAP), member 1
LTTNSNVIESGISQQFCLAIQASSFTIGLYVVAFIKSALLTLVATASVPVVVVAYGFAVPFMNKIWYESEAVKENASSLAFEIFQSIRIVVAFGAGERLTAKHSAIVEKARMIDRRLAPIMGALLAPMFLAIFSIFGLTFWFGVQQYSKGNIKNVGTIIV